MRWKGWIAAGYVGVLLACYGVRQTRMLPALPLDMKAITVGALDGDRRSSIPVRVAYRDYGGSTRATPILLLHGSPGESRVFSGLAPLLAERRRVLVPDLPGFGLSTTDLPDYSFRTHARYIRDLLDANRIEKVHVLGFSMGGGVALSLAELDRSRVASLDLVSAIGAQEMELLGEYHLNHAIHAVQLVALWLSSRAIPHLGLLDGPLPYARNFFDSDQRPLRNALRSVRVPTLLVHGRKDPLVPVEAAYEHARLIPQGELHVIDGDHCMVFEDPTIVATIVNDFLARADDGRAPTRDRADVTRVAAASRSFDPRVVPRAHAVNAVVMSVLMTGGSMAAGAVSAIFAGVLAAQNRVSRVLAFICCLVGSSLASLRRRSRARIARTIGTTLARVSIGLLVGAAVLSTAFLADTSAWVRAAIVTAFVFACAESVFVVMSARRRGLLKSSLIRLRHWEYWPPWIAYVPVGIYIAALMVKHRSATAFTAANPAIPASGFVGESKFDILRGLSASSPDLIARTGLIDGRLDGPAKLARADQLMSALEIELPVVLKPNEGQRGSGVVVARSREELIAYLSQTTVDTLIQEYVAGVEFGIFYARHSDARHGRILSVTRKLLPSVTADGHSTLERLILRHRRTLGMARYHLMKHRSQLNTVPAAGEVISLGDCGSHCRGATFLDGKALLTPQLERLFDQMARGYSGFYFGRFDVRVASVEDFVAGRRLKVIELNGVTSEATHIYDPAVSIGDAYRALFEQWRLAFEIGAANARRGARTSTVVELGQLLVKYRQDSRGHLVAAVQSSRR